MYKRRVLIIKLNRPKVNTIAGRLSITKNGLNKAFTTPNIKLAISITVSPSAAMPFKSVEATKRPKKLASQVNKNRLTTYTILAYLQILGSYPTISM
jgi:hypothetical protein